VKNKIFISIRSPKFWVIGFKTWAQL